MTAIELPDRREREEAITTTDRNVVVTAGAGTGKTTLLVDRIIHLLFAPPSPLKIIEIVAITFTNKAANEMRMRLNERLLSLIKREDNNKDMEEIITKYNLTRRDIESLAKDALTDLEKAQICTIHSFAAHLLRLYPMEVGIQPDFKEDNGTEFVSIFEQEWEEWLDENLSMDSPQKDLWTEILKKVDIASLKDLAMVICGEGFPLERLQVNMERRMAHWIEEKKTRADSILSAYADLREVKIKKLLRDAIEIFNVFLSDMDSTMEPLRVNVSGKAPKGWDRMVYEEAKEIVRTASALSYVNRRLINSIKDILYPFAIRFRREFTLSGNISFDGLLVHCRDLLRDNRKIRGELKQKFKALLIDEFQDTDPIQYEIVFYLAEKLGEYEKNWRNIKLTPGKLFIVGDPKQSIYSFRRADIEAYSRVVDIIEKKGHGIRKNLSTNFRSNRNIINVVNSLFSRMIKEREKIQPPYEPLAVHPEKVVAHPIQRVELRLIDSSFMEEMDASLAARLEAEALCRWLDEEVIGKEVIPESDGSTSYITYRHVALLLRKLTNVYEYLQAFRRYRIPYIVEGEKHFYTNQEIIDFVNLLRVIDNPSDRLALAGLLRSPLGGLSDREIYELHRLSLLDYTISDELIKRKIKDISRGEYIRPPEDLFKHLISVYGELGRLNASAGSMPVSEAIDYIFETLPVLDIAAYSFQGEQALANLIKIQRIADSLHDRGDITLKGFTAVLERKIRETEEESESLLAEEGVNAVRIMSIHRAKGLEFPMVILGGIHGGTGNNMEKVKVYHNWWNDEVGVAIRDVRDYTSVMLMERTRVREEEEDKRLLYVAMTRARECLILSGTIYRVQKGSFLSMLREQVEDVIGNNPDNKDIKEIKLDKGFIRQTIMVPDDQWLSYPVEKRVEEKISEGKPVDVDIFSRQWRERTERYKEIQKKSLFVSPSRLEEEMIQYVSPYIEMDRTSGKDLDRERAILTGIIIHSLLEGWDFSKDEIDTGEMIEDAVRRFIPPDSQIDIPSMKDDLSNIMQSFITSPIYEKLKRVHILGREVPFTIPWEDRIMEGIIDLIYEDSRKIYLADYKTDRISEKDLRERVDLYRHSAVIYMEAAKRCIGESIEGFQFIFLRPCKIVSLDKNLNIVNEGRR